jgi:hypothetical protein
MTGLAEVLRAGLPARVAGAADGWHASPTESGPGVCLSRGGGSVVCMVLPGLRGEWGQAAASVRAGLESLAEQVRDHQVLDLARSYPAFAALLVDALPPGQGWLAAVRLAEACLLIIEDAPTGKDVSASRVLPLVRRARFLLLTAPDRYAGVNYPSKSVLGSYRLFEAYRERARGEWAHDLINSDDHPYLRHWSAEQLDEELRRLIRVVDASGRDAFRALPAPPATDPTDWDGFGAWLVQEAFLPRFMLGAAWDEARRQAGYWPLLAVIPFLLMALAPVAGTRWGTGSELLRGTGCAAGATYLAIICLTIWRQPLAFPWCLRLPAGAALGMVALLSLDDLWAPQHGRWWLATSVALIGAAVGYLLLEASAHGVPRRRLLQRAVAVAVLGYVHAIGVAALVLAFVVPAVKPSLADKLAALTGTGTAAKLCLCAAVGLAAAVFLQVLWDDRPVTYPLSHLPWTGRVRT